MNFPTTLKSVAPANIAARLFCFASPESPQPSRWKTRCAGAPLDAGLSDACMPALPGPLLAGVREALMQEIAG